MREFITGVIISSFIWVITGWFLFYPKTPGPKPEGESVTVQGKFYCGINYIYLETENNIVPCEFPKSMTAFEICNWIQRKEKYIVTGKIEYWHSGSIKQIVVEKVKQSP